MTWVPFGNDDALRWERTPSGRSHLLRRDCGSELTIGNDQNLLMSALGAPVGSRMDGSLMKVDERVLVSTVEANGGWY